MASRIDNPRMETMVKNDYGQKVVLETEYAFRLPKGKRPICSNGVVIVCKNGDRTIAEGNRIRFMINGHVVVDTIISLEQNKKKILVAAPGEAIGVCLEKTNFSKLLPPKD